MANKKLFSNLKAVTVGAIAGSALVLSPIAAFAGDDAHGGDKSCKGMKATDEKSCKGEKKGDHHCKGEKGEKHCAGDKHDEKSCKGDKSCSGDKGCSGEKHDKH